MADDDNTSAQSRRVQRRNPNARVRLVNDPSADASESGLGKVIFEHEDEQVARKYVETHHPRGREVVLQTADGRVGHFSADHKAQGHENEGWIDFSDDEV